MRTSLVLLVGVVLVGSGCGGGSSSGPPVSVSLSPTAASVHLLRTKQFTAAVANAANAVVTWSISGADCSGAQAACGSVSSTGLYTAPASLPSPASVTVTATSAADSSKSASAAVTLLPSVVVTVTPPNQTIGVGATQQYSATIQHALDSSLTWAVSGAGCTGSACGTISATGLYTAPASVPNPPAITITATSVEDSLTSSSVPATVASTVTISAWPPKALVTVDRTYQFGVVVGGTTNTAVNWTLSGGGCTGAACGTISATGLYTAPAVVPNPDIVSLTVASQVDPAKTATATVRLLSTNLAKLNGAFSFLYQGFTGTAPGITAGMCIADAQGNITYGYSDRIAPDYAGGNLSASFTGTYQVGDDNRGYLYLHSHVFGDANLAFALDAAGDTAFIQPFMDVSTRLLGTLAKQNLPTADNSAIKGDYVFQWLGADSSGNRLGALGRLHADGYGHITGGNLDINNQTSVQADLAVTGTYSVSITGRATMTLTVASVGTLHLIAYAVDAGRFFIESSDAVSSTVPMWSGTALAQSGGPFSNASLQGTGVFGLLGRQATSGARASVGLMTADSNCGISGLADINAAGVVTANASYTATCAIRADGRGTLTSSTIPSLEFYLVSPGTALLMGSSGPTVDLGTLEPQVPMTYGLPALLGQYAQGGSVPPPYPTNEIITATVWYDSTGLLSFHADVNSSVSGLSLVSASGTVVTVAANGRGVSTDFYANHGYVYLISPIKHVAIGGNIPQAAFAPAIHESESDSSGTARLTALRAIRDTRAMAIMHAVSPPTTATLWR